MADRKKTYTPMPEVPEEIRPRFQAVIDVLSGNKTVVGAAESLGLPRNHFQTVMHRGMEGLIEGLSPKPPGRPPTPPKEAELQRQVDQLRQDNARLSQRIETFDRLLGVASGLLRGRVKASGRTSKPRTKKTPTPEREEPDGSLEGARQMRALGLTMVIVAAILGVTASTLRRWRARNRAGLAIRRKPGPASQRPRTDTHTAAAVEDVVRTTHGLAGAESLRRSVPEVSRREAAIIKAETLAEMERERRASTSCVEITQPGVVRGFDQLWAATTTGLVPVLVSADACVPYRTSLIVAEAYDSASVVCAIDADFRCNGAPLVWRADRASCHRTADVDELLAAWGVLRLHGPAHLPRYYGQLERQNREHRAWLVAHGVVDRNELPAVCDRMASALNCAWRRPTLDWQTSAEIWTRRPTVNDDRSELRAEVADRAARIARDLDDRGTADGVLAHRLAVEAALTKRGYLRQQPGGWC